MSSENFEKNHKNDEKVIKKSTFNILISSIIITVGVASFFAGSYVSNFNSEQISQEEFKNEIAKLELKILEKQLSTKQLNSPLKISTDNDPIIGQINAPITIIEFSDFQCPFCAKFHIETLPLIMNEYINNGQVKLVFRDFPIQSIHPNAVPAAVAAECANEQEKFKEMHDILFENQNEWSNQNIDNVIITFNQYATKIELDDKKFDSCLKNGKYIEEIKKDLDEGRAYGISGTPGFFIGNEQIGFIELKGAEPFENFKKVIDNQLKK
ncbi:MAG: disulfide bond formation protein DsbA [Thaumarchaeota archaeon]|nr:DsbA family protein [Nitrosopumilus sp.]PHY03821.1 MAG: disulfide bond formation protein DsbA [Nitrososphaerota archaeon]